MKLMARIMLLIIFAVMLTGGGILLYTRYIEKHDNAQLFYVTSNFGEDPVKVTHEDIVFPILLWGGLGLLAVSAGAVLIYSHRIAGPLYRINNELNRLAGGETGSDINLRKRDEFKELALSVNRVKDMMRKERVRRIKGEEEAEALKEEIKAGESYDE